MILVLPLSGCASIRDYLPDNFRTSDAIILFFASILSIVFSLLAKACFTELIKKAPSPSDQVPQPNQLLRPGEDIPVGQEPLPGLETPPLAEIPAGEESSSGQDRSQETSTRPPKWRYGFGLVITIILSAVLAVFTGFFWQHLKTKYSNQEADFKVSFIVKDKESVTPVEGASILIYPANSHPFGGVTNDSGSITLELNSDLENKRAGVTVQASGYKDSSENIVLQKGSLQLFIEKLPHEDEDVDGIPSPTPRVFPSSGITKECIDYGFWSPYNGNKRYKSDNCVVLSTWGFIGLDDDLLGIFARNTGETLEDGLNGIYSKSLPSNVVIDYTLSIFDDIEVSPGSSINLKIGIGNPSIPSGETGHFIYYHYNPHNQGRLVLRHGPYGEYADDIFEVVELDKPLIGTIKVNNGVMSFYHGDDLLLEKIWLGYTDVALWIGYSIKPANEMNAELELEIIEK